MLWATEYDKKWKPFHLENDLKRDLKRDLSGSTTFSTNFSRHTKSKIEYPLFFSLALSDVGQSGTVQRALLSCLFTMDKSKNTIGVSKNTYGKRESVGQREKYFFAVYCPGQF